MPRRVDHTEALLAAAAEQRIEWHMSGRGHSYRITTHGESRRLSDTERRDILKLLRLGRLDRGTHGGTRQEGPVVLTPGEQRRRERAAARAQAAGAR